MRHLAVAYRVLATLAFAQAINWAYLSELTHAAVCVALGAFCFTVGERVQQ